MGLKMFEPTNKIKKKTTDPIRYLVGQASVYGMGCGFGKGLASVREPKNEAANP